MEQELHIQARHRDKKKQELEACISESFCKEAYEKMITQCSEQAKQGNLVQAVQCKQIEWDWEACYKKHLTLVQDLRVTKQ